MFKKLMVIGLVAWFGASRAIAADERRMVVAADGSGEFKTVQEAIDTIPANNKQPCLIEIKPGIYKAQLRVPKGKPFITFRGEDATKTVLTNNLSARMIGPDGKELGTAATASTFVDADDFTAENITFENTAGDVGQALALSISGDRVRLKNCRLLGWQDTLYVTHGRQYFADCYIAGHCDYIFGDATAVFENCKIHSLKANYITAASTPQNQPFGLVFLNCKLTGEGEGTYLGRPWRDYASVTFINCDLGAFIKPEGWHNWKKPEREQTARYAEYQSAGPGAAPKARVAWSRQLGKDEATKITVENVLGGSDHWDPRK